MTASSALSAVSSRKTPGEKRVARRVVVFICLLLAVVLPAGFLEAQQPKKIFRLGYLSNTDAATDSARAEGIRLALRELGYIQEQNIAIEYRYAKGKRDREPELAAELVRLKVDIIVVPSGDATIRAAKNATKTIPIVMAGLGSDPVTAGHVESLARPGGNVTGLSNLRPELSGKRLELLKEIVPGLSRVAVLASSNEPDNAGVLKEIELAAGAFGVQLQVLDVLSSKDIEIAFLPATKAHTDALLVVDSATLAGHRRDIANLALQNRLPAIYGSSDWVEPGGPCGLWAEFCRLGPTSGDLRR